MLTQILTQKHLLLNLNKNYENNNFTNFTNYNYNIYNFIFYVIFYVYIIMKKLKNKKVLKNIMKASDIEVSDSRASDIFANYKTSEFKKIVIDKL